MQVLIDMASSPHYLAQSAHSQVDTNTASLPDVSCPHGPSSAVAYPDPQDLYGPVSNTHTTPLRNVAPRSHLHMSHGDLAPAYITQHSRFPVTYIHQQVSPFSNPVVDENLLTPVSSAGSPPLHHRHKIQSPYHQQQDSSSCSQQPTPPNTSTMYTYPDYLSGTTQASSPMPVQNTVSHAPHDMLYIHHHSPGHEDPLPPPQANPYFGHYSASAVSVGQEADGIPSYQNYMNNGMHDSYASLPDIGGNYTHRPLAPSTHTPMAPILQQPPPGPYRRDVMPISRLSPTPFSRPAHVVVKRHPSRKPRVRSKGNMKREASSSPPMPQAFGFDGSTTDPDAATAEEVTLDEKTPSDLKRLWEIRKKWQKKKGHGMWEDIVREFMGPESDNLTGDKKTQLKANLQMRVHRGVMKYGSWPESDVSTQPTPISRTKEITS